MSTASTQSPMRVAVQNRHRKQAGYRVCIGRRAGDSTSRVFLHGPAFPLIDNLPAIPSAVSHALTPLDSGVSGRLSEADPLVSLVCRSFLNSRGGIKALRCLSFNALVQFLQEPASRVFHRFSLSPVLLLPAAHGNNHASRSDGNAQNLIGEVRNVQR